MYKENKMEATIRLFEAHDSVDKDPWHAAVYSEDARYRREQQDGQGGSDGRDEVIDGGYKDPEDMTTRYSRANNKNTKVQRRARVEFMRR